MSLQNFIVFEGIDGSGTSTQIELLKRRREAKDFVFTSEPTQGKVGKFLRQILSGKTKLSPQATAYLFAADRAEHLWGKGGILDLAESGKTIVSDRYLFSSLAYQSATCGEDMPKIINVLFPLPQIVFFLEIAPETALKRIAARGEKREIYENFESLVATSINYRQVIDTYKSKVFKDMRIVEIDATLPKREIAKIVWDEIKKIREGEGMPAKPLNTKH